MSQISAAMRSMLSTPGPTVAVEVAPDGVTAVALRWARTGPVLAAHATESLPAGAVSPSVASSNIIDRAVVTAAVRAVLGRLPGRTSRVGLVMPDGAAKVSLLPFETVPGRVADLDELIRWRMRKAAPFRVEDAQLAYTPGTALPGGGREYIVVMMRRDIVEEYEAVCVDAGVQPGLVDLTSFNLINATLVDSPPPAFQDWVLVHVAAGYHTLAIIRGQDLIFFRNRAAGDGDEGALTDLVHQSVMYYQDRLEGGGIQRTVLAVRTSGDGEGDERTTAMLKERLDNPVEVLTSGLGAGGNGSGAPHSIAQLAAPIGLLLRARGPVA
jgi:type IV pilus assembly protein PilM